MKDTPKFAAKPPAPKPAAKTEPAPAAKTEPAPAAKTEPEPAAKAETAPAAKAETAPAAPAKSAGPKVHIVFDAAGRAHGAEAQAALEKMGVQVSIGKVSPLANYMRHEDQVYVPGNLADQAGKILAALRKVRSQLVDSATGDGDTIYVWFVR